MRKVAPAAALLLCTCLLGCDGALRVPRILHRNFMAGEKALYEAARDPKSGFKAHWLASCKVHNPEWHEVVWDADAVLSLIEQDFPWFLTTYLSYPKLVQRSDAARYMILYKHGGVYLDADVECYGPLEQPLQDKDLILNCEWPEKQAQIHNAVMASAPKNPFWLKVLREAMLRSPGTAAGSGRTVPAAEAMPSAFANDESPAAASVINPAGQLEIARDLTQSIYPAVHELLASGMDSSSHEPLWAMGLVKKLWVEVSAYRRQLLAKVQQLWEASPFHDKINAVLWSTGPMLLTKVYKDHIGGRHVCGHSHDVDGLVTQVYELGSWFTPCFWKDFGCQRRWVTQHFLLTRKHSQQLQPQSVIGIHHYSGSWIDWGQGTKQQQEQQENELALEASKHVLEFFTGPLFIEYNCSSPMLATSSNTSSEVAATPICIEFLPGTGSSEKCAVVTVVSNRQTADASVDDSAPASTVDGAATAAGDCDKETCSNPDSPLTFLDDAAAAGVPAVDAAAASDTAAATAAAADSGFSNPPEQQLESMCSMTDVQDAASSTTATSIEAAAAQGRHVVSMEQQLQQLGCSVTALSSSSKPMQSTHKVADGDGPTEKSKIRQLHGRLGIAGIQEVAEQQQQQLKLQTQQPSSATVDVGVVTLQELLQLAHPRHSLQVGSQGHEQQDAAGNSAGEDSVIEASESVEEEPPARYILRLVCDECSLYDMVQALDYSSTSAATDKGPLQHVELLLLDLHDVAAAGLQGVISDYRHADEGKSSGSGSREFVCKEGICANGSGTASKQGTNSIKGLDALYNLLYQQYGFKGFYREVVSGSDAVGSVLKLGWVRQPHRLTREDS